MLVKSVNLNDAYIVLKQESQKQSERSISQEKCQQSCFLTQSVNKKFFLLVFYIFVALKSFR